MSVQIRTYYEVCSAANESRRFAQEAQALLSLDHQIIQRQYEMLNGQQVQMCRRGVMTEIPAENALGLTTGDAVGEGDNDGGGGGYLMPPPAYGPPALPPLTMAGSLSTMGKLTPTGPGSGSGRNTPTSSTLSTGYLSDATSSTASAPPTPTPTKATFVVEETKTRTTMTTTAKTETTVTDSTPPIMIRALKEMHRAQDSVDAAADEATLRGTLAGALDAHNDVEMVRCLQVSRGEIPEAAETFRRMLGVEGMGVDGNERLALEHGERGVDTGSTELDRKFMQTGIEAMMRLSSVVAKQPQDQLEQGGTGRDAGAVGAPKLPSWTITRCVIVILLAPWLIHTHVRVADRYEVIRTRKIGMGFFSDVYLGHWRKLTVVVKVLAHSVSREAFVRHVEQWNVLDHPNVLPLYGASSAAGEKPWFLVSKFCSGDNLAASLKRARVVGAMVVGDKATARVDLLRFMHEIAKGMAYLHGCGVLHGDLRVRRFIYIPHLVRVADPFDRRRTCWSTRAGGVFSLILANVGSSRKRVDHVGSRSRVSSC